MDIYLMQHGAAVAESEDPARPLTAAGRMAVERVAARVRVAGLHVDRCLHSGKLRAVQTATLLAAVLGADLQDRAGLNPGDPVAPFADWLADQARRDPGGSIAIVGHLPFLDRLTSLLVAGAEDAHAVQFQNAALVKLVPDPTGTRFSVAWILPPDLA